MIYCEIILFKYIFFLGRTNGGGRSLNASHSEDSVAETNLSKKNSDGKFFNLLMNGVD